ncbi:MAG: hypothetical protein M3N16_02235 [Actinomycetota bacterium]|nr:hypothetical protein [Actinomycetota bacterium]
MRHVDSFDVRIPLIGGPKDGGQLRTGRQPQASVLIDGARYMFLETYPLASEVPDGWVGVWLPLYAAWYRQRRRSDGVRRPEGSCGSDRRQRPFVGDQCDR